MPNDSVMCELVVRTGVEAGRDGSHPLCEGNGRTKEKVKGVQAQKGKAKDD